MSLYTDYITLTNLMGRVDDLSEIEVNCAADLAHLIVERCVSTLVRMTEIFDEHLDDNGMWDEPETCLEIANLLSRTGFFLDCPEGHGYYARNKPQCPTCEGDQ